MGRPRQFDEGQVIAAAAAVFRQRGFACTSVDHLVEATGIHRGSLYGAFGSKHGVFLRVLESVDAPEVTSTDRLDLVLVALLELAPADRRVRDRIARLIEARAITREQLGTRLLARARLYEDEEEQ